MWPWEHLAVGYVLVTLTYRRYTGRAPSDAAAIAVILGTQFPDLVDTPLAWCFEVVTSGVSITHFVFVATALSVLANVLARRLGHPAVGVGFAVDYLVHLPAGVRYPFLLGKGLPSIPFLWPLYVSDGGGVTGGFLASFASYLVEFIEFLATPRGMTFRVLELVFLSVAAWVWIADGYPGFPLPSCVCRWAV